ncbi:hypothetical protein TYRP_022875 [Tyrophagus putrescentiae]|nr:hypothetical protein TYRP_022875 [Tyrophagus putrescentiae]
MAKNSVLNFNWTVLNVSVNHYIPNCEVIRHPVQLLNNDHKYKKQLYSNINSKHNIISISGGFEIEILKALEAKYHFTSHYIDGRQMWGVRQQNGSWDGMVKQIQDNDCQVALCSTSRTLERMAVVDYSETTHLDEITFVSLWPDRLSKDLTLALPLERAVWVLTFIAFIVISLLLYFFTSKGKRKPSFSLILLHLLAIYLNKSVELWRGRTLLEGTKDESGSRILFTRMLYCFWAVGSMVLSIGYGCKLYSTLTSPSHAQPLDSVGELLAAVTSDSHNVFVKRNTALWSLIFAASEKNFLYYSLAKHIIRNPVIKSTILINQLSLNHVDQFNNMILFTFNFVAQWIFLYSVLANIILAMSTALIFLKRNRKSFQWFRTFHRNHYHTLGFFFTGNFIYGHLFSLYLVIHGLLNVAFVMLLTNAGHRSISLFRQALILAFVVDEFNVIFGVHLILSLITRCLHRHGKVLYSWTSVEASEQAVHHPRKQKTLLTIGDRLKVAGVVANLVTRRPYSFTYSTCGVISLQNFARYLVFYCKFLMITHKLIKKEN